MKKVLLFLVLAFFALCSCSDKKIGYINLPMVFNDFTYKKELERELADVTNSRKRILDSLEADLKILAKRISAEENNRLLLEEYQDQKNIFLEKKSVYAEEEELLAKSFDEKIVVQLNSYVKEFGKKEKYAVIYGANTSGNIMYADSAFDLTKQVTLFINEKFKGKH